MDQSKLLKNLTYGLALFLTAAAGFVFWQAGKISGELEDLGESSGIALAVVLGLEGLLFFGLAALRIKGTPLPVRRGMKTVTKQLMEYHRPMGALTVSALLFHGALTLELSRLYDFSQITGLITALFVLASIAAGAACKGRRTPLYKMHTGIAFFSVFFFATHLLD